ncbi:MAG: glycosyltransferase family 2 protein [bacterium]
MNNPKISIIIPSYNHGKELLKCLNSIFTQTFRDFEVIVVNDGSTDGTDDILKNYKNKEISCLCGEIKVIIQQNQGAPVARNNGFKISKGAYLLFCDADAVLRKDALEKMVEVLDNIYIPPVDSKSMNMEINRNSVDLLPSKRGCGDVWGCKIGYVYANHKFGKKIFKLFPFDEKKIKENNYIHTMALIRREAFPKDGFDPNLKKFQDWDLWLTMLENGYKGVWLDEFLFTCKPREKKEKGNFLPKSSWLPGFMYKIPWKKFGIKIKAIEDYKYWRDVVRIKHGLVDKINIMRRDQRYKNNILK